MEIILWVSYGYPMGILWYSLVIGRLQSRFGMDNWWLQDNFW